VVRAVMIEAEAILFYEPYKLRRVHVGSPFFVLFFFSDVYYTLNFT
jgi:hypothetical protein